MQGLKHPFGQSLCLWFRLARSQLGKSALLYPLVPKDCSMVNESCTHLGWTLCAMVDGVLCVWVSTDTPLDFWVAFRKDSCQYRLGIFIFPPDISHRLLSAAPFLWGVGKNRINILCQKQLLIVVFFRWGWQGRELECHVFNPGPQSLFSLWCFGMITPHLEIPVY